MNGTRFGSRAASNLVTLQQDGPIATITLNDPDRLNALTVDMANDLTQVIHEIKAQPKVRVPWGHDAIDRPAYQDPSQTPPTHHHNYHSIPHVLSLSLVLAELSLLEVTWISYKLALRRQPMRMLMS